MSQVRRAPRFIRIGDLRASFVGKRFRQAKRIPLDGEIEIPDAKAPEHVAHSALVRQEMRHVGADARESERLSDRRDDGDSTVRRDGQNAVHAEAARDLHHRVDVSEVDHLRDVGRDQAGCIGVPVDRRDLQAARTRLLDRATLVSSATDEEDRCHGRRW